MTEFGKYGDAGRKSHSERGGGLQLTPHNARDAVITGLGMITPLGITAQDSWAALLQQQTAGRLLNSTDIDHLPQLSRLLQRAPGGAPVQHAQVSDILKRRSAEDSAFQQVVDLYAFDSLNRLLLAATFEALDDARLPASQLAGPRTACVIGTSKASLRAMEAESLNLRIEHPLPAMHWNNAFLPDAPLRCVRDLLRATGPALCPVAACATGLVSVIQGAAMIRTGLADVCVVGSGDASLRSSVLAAFHRLGVTSKHADPAVACRPFDQNRDGFIVGEGAAVMVLEAREHAEQRAAECYGQIQDGRWLTDPTGLTQIDSSGRIVREVLKQLDGCGPVNAPDLISLHGTGTLTNDLAEAAGVADYYGSLTPRCFAVKGAIGHLLGAAGSVELGFTVLALKNQLIPATSNCYFQDPVCSLPLHPMPVASNLKQAVKLSLGFGGHVAACRIVAE